MHRWARSQPTSAASASPRSTAPKRRRSGKVMILLAIMLPSLFGIVGLVIDGGLMMSEYRNLQHAADAAATASAMALNLGKGADVAVSTANEVITEGNSLANAAVTVNIPPASGPYAGRHTHVEVLVEGTYSSRFMKVLDGVLNRTMRARAVAGVESGATGAAIVVLDPDPADLSLDNVSDDLAAMDANSLAANAVPQTGATDSLAPIPVIGPLVAGLVNTSLGNLLPPAITTLIGDASSQVSVGPLPALTAGLEIEGIGRLQVDGAIHVNTEWGGMDENGDPAGTATGFRSAMACMPILPLTRLRAREIRVVGGVDNREYYGPYDAEEPNPLMANRLPVADPLESLPVPSTNSDPSNVTATVHSPAHSVRVALTTSQASAVIDNVLTLLSPLAKSLFTPLTPELTARLTEPTLQPGVYDSITVFSPLGGATFAPGVYVIRGTSPLTRLSLCILGPVKADGVLFYITDSAAFSASTGQPDAGEDAGATPANTITSLPPSAVIAPLLPGARISGLNAPGSPFDGMLVYQRRLDRRPIVIEAQQLLGGGDIAGTIYSKWGHTIFLAGAGSYDLRFVTGTMRVLTVTTTTIAPTTLFPPATDVMLLE